jgi:hypothetical protein
VSKWDKENERAASSASIANIHFAKMDFFYLTDNDHQPTNIIEKKGVRESEREKSEINLEERDRPLRRHLRKRGKQRERGCPKVHS